MKLLSEWPTFSKQYENTHNPGSHFRGFIAELFAQLFAHNHPKHGESACLAPDGSLWECQFVPTAGLNAATACWKKIHQHLMEDLLPGQPPLPLQPTPCELWFDTLAPIQRYHFCLSNTVENAAGLKQLEALIHDDFVALSSRAGLAHLAHIKVKVWSWENLLPEVKKQPQLRLKWFVPPMFAPLEQWMRHTDKGFCSYLTQAVLPLVALPGAAFSPQQLLAANKKCSVLTGISGTGKTRLLVETAALAQRQGWQVFIANDHLKPGDIARLARMLGDQQALIGLDNLGHCAQFEQVLNAVNEANENGNRIYLLATCRQSYWHQIDHLDLPRYSMAQLDLKHVVQQILGPQLQAFAPQCGNVPVFAALVRFLAANHQTLALQELQEAPEFGAWMIDHILKAGNPGRQLSLFDQACFMLPGARTPFLSPTLAAWCHALEQEGWLVPTPGKPGGENTMWQLAHHVFADGIVLRVLEDANSRQANLVRLLENARACNALPQALRRLHRITENMPGIDWLQIFAADQPGWRSHVDEILASRLIGVTSCLTFLHWYQADAAQLAECPEIQGALGFVTRELVKERVVLDQAQQVVLAQWLAAAVQAGGEFNFVLTQALLWRPAQYKATALKSLRLYPREYQTHFLLTAWLNIANKFDDVKMGQQVTTTVSAWLGQYAMQPATAFVIVAWLNARQDPALVSEAVQQWLRVTKNSVAPEAGFILRAWLAAKQAPDLIEPAMRTWLAHEDNATTFSAQFIYRAWGDHFKSLDDFMFDNACRWIQTHYDHPDATFGMKWIIADRRLNQATVNAILGWLTTFPGHEDAPSRLSRLHFNVLHHYPKEKLINLYTLVLEKYIERTERFSEWDVKTAFYLCLNAMRIARKRAVHRTSRLALARLFCSFLRKLSIGQLQQVPAISKHLIGGALPSLILLALQNGEAFDLPLENATEWLEQMYLGLGESGASAAALLHQITRKKSQK